jgi:hypothetical protein
MGNDVPVRFGVSDKDLFVVARVEGHSALNDDLFVWEREWNMRSDRKTSSGS